MKVGDDTDIYLADTTRSAPVRRLTSTPGADSDPVMSPDRRTVVYLHTEGRRTLRVMAVDGSGQRDLFDPAPDACADPSRPAWNPTDPTVLAIACEDGAGDDGSVDEALHELSGRKE